jgi:hypothetical protein
MPERHAKDEWSQATVPREFPGAWENTAKTLAHAVLMINWGISRCLKSAAVERRFPNALNTETNQANRETRSAISEFNLWDAKADADVDLEPQARPHNVRSILTKGRSN